MKLIALLIAAVATSCGACSSLPGTSRTATSADAPKLVEVDPATDKVLTCIRNSGQLRDVVIGVGPWVDSTGKGNSVANGATGLFLPQAGTASFVTDTLRRMGAKPLVMYFGAAEKRVKARFVINGIFNALDFGSGIDVDVRIFGIGPTAQAGWAQLTMTVQMDEAATRLNRQTAVVSRAVRFSQLGATSGKTFGAALVTGGVQVQDQQRLQFESINGPIAAGVIEVASREFPDLAKCSGQTPRA